jgi:drug/metabolite transporter (DMT)-like permease
MEVGVAAGLCAAFFLSVSYVCSRVFLARFPGGAVSLLASSHVLMGILAAMILTFLVPATLPCFAEYAVPLIGTIFFYFLAQFGLFQALRTADASRVSPLLGLKIVVLALISEVFLGERFSGWRWGGVLLSVGAGGMLSLSSEGKVAWASVGWVVATCIGYSLSDLLVKEFIDAFMDLGLVRGSLAALCVCYFACGIVGAAMLIRLPRVTRRMWRNCLPFAATWFVAMFFLFVCFARIGVVFGNIVQSSRGVISVLVGLAVGAAGLVQVEESMTMGRLLWKGGAAVAMTVSIALYYLGA